MRSFQEQSKRKENHREQDEILYFWAEKRRKKKFPSMGETHAVIIIYVHRHSECVIIVMLHSISSVPLQLFVEGEVNIGE